MNSIPEELLERVERDNVVLLVGESINLLPGQLDKPSLEPSPSHRQDHSTPSTHRLHDLL
jgi:hypothetical protein